MRRKLEQYYTPQIVANAAVRRLLADGWIRPALLTLEPHCGQGAWVTAMKEIASADVDALDIDPAAAAVVRPNGGAATFQCVDFLSEDWAGEMRWDLIIGNPPFSRDTGRVNAKGNPIMETVFLSHVEQALELADTVVFLLRHSAFASAERAAWWRDHMPAAVYRLFPRPSFTNGGTDSAEYDVFVWAQAQLGRPELGMIEWRGEA